MIRYFFGLVAQDLKGKRGLAMQINAALTLGSLFLAARLFVILWHSLGMYSL